MANDKYDWWPKDKARSMLIRLLGALDATSDDGGALCIRQGPNADGKETTLLDVVDGKGTLLTEDDGFGCPPLCRR